MNFRIIRKVKISSQKQGTKNTWYKWYLIRASISLEIIGFYSYQRHLLHFVNLNLQTKQKLENGYEFFLSFLSVLVNASTFIFFMLVVISQEERKPKDPFYLFRYVSYVFLFLLAIAPFIYLWSMQDVIMHLNWDKPFSR